MVVCFLNPQDELIGLKGKNILESFPCVFILLSKRFSRVSGRVDMHVFLEFLKTRGEFIFYKDILFQLLSR